MGLGRLDGWMSGWVTGNHPTIHSSIHPVAKRKDDMAENVVKLSEHLAVWRGHINVGIVRDGE